jgi:hypothetical protein
MGYTKATDDDVESVIDDAYGGMWFLRDELDAESERGAPALVRPDPSDPRPFGCTGETGARRRAMGVTERARRDPRPTT